MSNLREHVLTALAKLKVRPKRSLSQNFLITDKIADNIASHVHVHPRSLLIEVGPGLGSLTRYLLPSHTDMVLIEKDDVFFQYLEEEFKSIQCIHADVRDINFIDLFKISQYDSLTIVSNLPYQISTEFFEILLPLHDTLTQAVVLVQKEYAQKVVQSDTFISYAINALFKVKTPFDVAPSHFYPKPKAESTLVTIEPHQDVTFSINCLKLLKHVFTQKKRTLVHSLQKFFSEGPSFIESVLEKRKKNKKARILDFSPKELWTFLEELVPYISLPHS